MFSKELANKAITDSTWRNYTALGRKVASSLNASAHVYLTQPNKLFQFLEDHPEWEEIDAIPYSKCYRHMVGSGDGLVADYIMCKVS